MLSAVWPGLGHGYLGRRRAAVLFALPPLIAVLLIVAWAALGGIERVAVGLFTPTLSLTMVVLIGLLGVWRLVAMADAYLSASGRGIRTSRRGGAVLAAAIGVVLVFHAGAVYYAWSFYDAGRQIFVDPGTAQAEPSPSGSFDPAQDFNATPAVTPETASSRITILLTGIDSGGTRDHALNDTIIVASVDPVAKTASLISFPRDTARFPLYSGGTYTGKINSLMTYARLHPQQFPDGPANTLVKELGFLLGIPVHYYAAVNLDGFVKMIDAVGGVDVVNPRLINDPTYGGWTNGHAVGFYLTAGKHHLDGQTALAYVRSRKGAGDNDFTRAARQQQLLVALAHKMTDPSVIVKLPQLLQAASGAIRTNFPADRASEMLSLAKEIPSDAITRTVLGPTKYATRPPYSETGGVYLLELKMDEVAKLSVSLFGSDSAYAADAGTQASPSPSP